jgi:hypothetical protein
VLLDHAAEEQGVGRDMGELSLEPGGEPFHELTEARDRLEVLELDPVLHGLTVRATPPKEPSRFRSAAAPLGRPHAQETIVPLAQQPVGDPEGQGDSRQPQQFIGTRLLQIEDDELSR